MLAAAVLWLSTTQGFAAEVRTIGIVLDGSTPVTTATADVFRKEIRSVVGNDFDVRFPEDQLREGHFEAAAITIALDEALADRGLDLVLTLGPISSHDASRRTSLRIPTIAPFVMDTTLEATPMAAGASGVRNLHYLTTPNQVDRDFRTLHGLSPFEHLVALVHAPYIPLIAGQPKVSSIAELGFSLQILPITFSAADALASLPAGTDAVYVGPAPSFSDGELAALAEGLAERKLPSFSSEGKRYVEQGVLAGLKDERHLRALARQTGLAVSAILRGREPSTISVMLTETSQLYLNMATATTIGLSPTWDVLDDAILLHAEDTRGEPLGLRQAVQQAIANSPQVKASGTAVEVARSERVRAWSRWLPQIGASGTGAFVNKETAEATFGIVPEVDVDVAATATQLIYDDAARVAIPIQRDLLAAERATVEVAAADLANDIALAWLDVLRSSALVQVRTNDLQTVRTNLSVARVQQSVGEVGPAEVARWDAEVARARGELVNARAAAESTRFRVNQLRGMSGATRFHVVVADGWTADEIANDGGLAALLSTSAGLDRSAEALVAVGLGASPELAAIDAGISARRRWKGVTDRAWFLPTAGGQFEVGYQAYRSTLDTSDSAFSVFTDQLPEWPDWNWTAGVEVTLPLFSGRAREADGRKARQELAELEYTREHVARSLELRIRASLVDAHAAFMQTHLTARAATAAGRALEWANDAYARGATSQVRLLEARGAFLNANLAATDATYACQAKVLMLERAIAHQRHRMSEPAWLEFYAAMIAAFQADGSTP